MPDSRKDAYEYFRKTPGFDRCFQELRKKWNSYGRAAGIVKLTAASKEERRALEGFFGKSFADQTGGTLSFSVQAFEAALKETAYGELNLQQLMELYFGEPMKTNAARKAEREEQIRLFFENCRQFFLRREHEMCETAGTAADWIETVFQEKKYGYQIILKEWKRNPNNAERLVRTVGMALEMVVPDGGETSGGSIMLAVLAARVSGDPHCFDRGTAAGQLLVSGLCWDAGVDIPSNAEELFALYLRYGIQMDEISSMVAVSGLHLERNGTLHPGLEGFLQAGEPFLLMQKNLDGVTRAYGAGSCVFVVENEMVFSHLCEQSRRLPEGGRPALLCTMGQPRKAAWQLLDLLTAENPAIFYAGDLDPEGMDIADRIWKRYPDAVHLWRMGPEDYEKSRSEEEISDRRLSMLSRLQNPLLRSTAAQIQKEKKAGYQEALLDEMLADIRERVCL
ncbi:MAG: TIGR02679 family protein [Anaerovoracaceae bacterium]|nr:TIGR02679 family protein [Anaerovoracaceae bacterium]